MGERRLCEVCGALLPLQEGRGRRRRKCVDCGRARRSAAGDGSMVGAVRAVVDGSGSAGQPAAVLAVRFAELIDAQAGTSGVEAPRLREGLHPLAVKWFKALAASSQARFYQPSDWATALIAVEAVDDYARSRKPAALQAVMMLSSSLLVTEADRRRVLAGAGMAAAAKQLQEAVDRLGPVAETSSGSLLDELRARREAKQRGA